MTVRLFLFGAPAVEVGGQSHALPFERRNQLLVFLALKRAWVGRPELAALLWPEQQSKLAYTNLRKTLHRLQSLQWATGIESQGSALRFEADTDVLAFDAALRERRIAEALPMRRGELLSGFDDDQSEAWSSWLSFERDRLRLTWRDAALNRLAADIDTVEGIDLSTQLLDSDPLDEAALRAQMSWLARSGQSARARQAYHEFVQRLADDLGLAPGAELRALHDSLGIAVRSPTHPAPTATVTLDDQFVGRIVELRRISTLLAQDDCRLLSLIGPGGAGKTRLAQRALQELAPAYLDGAVFVPLEDISSSSELGSRLARELGVGLAGSSDPLDQVIEFLRERQVLLVLDNFEQLAADASILQKLMQACERLKVIVTSRVRLAVSMEWLLPVEGMPCPDLEDQDSFEAFDSVRLFIQAAQRVEPTLIPTAEAASIVDICRQVGGLPLALELAAAWTRVLSCDAIATELRQGTELLHAVDPAHPPRHASLEVVFEQSWRLLSNAERDALSRLSVFHGGFSAEAARAIAGAPLPVLGALADKSLLRKDGARIFLHPLVQQLAAVRLGDEIRESTEKAHALYFHRLMAQLRRGVENGDREALQKVDIEFENCRMAWRWSIAEGATDALTHSVQTVTQFCDHRGRLDEGLAMLRHAAASPGLLDDPNLHALLLGKAAHLEYRLDRYADAITTATLGMKIVAAPDADAQVQCLRVLGTCHLRLGHLGVAKRFFEESLKLAPACSDVRHPSAVLSSLALIQKALANYDAALRLSIESLELQRRLGDVAGEALSLNNLAALHIEQQQFEAAGEYLKPALVLCERHGLATTRVYVLSNLAEVAMKIGQHEAAEAYGGRALEHAQAIGNRSVVSYLKFQFVRFALRRRDVNAARAELRSGMELAIEVGRPALLIGGVACFAEILAAQEDVSSARAVMSFAAEHPATAPIERDLLHQALARLPSTDEAQTPWPGLSLEELAHRVVVESDIAHAPLIATLRRAA